MCGSQGGSIIATKSGMMCRGSDESWGTDVGVNNKVKMIVQMLQGRRH